jgi:hypothetical protein
MSATKDVFKYKRYFNPDPEQQQMEHLARTWTLDGASTFCSA